MPPAAPAATRVGVKVLIVEDSPLVRKMYGLVFSKREHELTTAEDGRKALEVLTSAAGRFDLILLDLRMPDMDGVEFIRAVRRIGRFRDIPIVLTTVEPDGSPLLQEAVGPGRRRGGEEALEARRSSGRSCSPSSTSRGLEMAHSFLVVDDSKLHHQMYKLVFSRGALAGSTVHHANNGREGYTLLAAHPELSLVCSTSTCRR